MSNYFIVPPIFSLRVPRLVKSNFSWEGLFK